MVIQLFSDNKLTRCLYLLRFFPLYLQKFLDENAFSAKQIEIINMDTLFLIHESGIASPCERYEAPHRSLRVTTKEYQVNL